MTLHRTYRATGQATMKQVKIALALSTAHGLPRTVTSKSIYVKIAWLLIFLFMLGLFLSDLVQLVIKLQDNKITTSTDSGAVKFKFPDIYACLENPISGSYAVNIDETSAKIINTSISTTHRIVLNYIQAKGIRLEYFNDSAFTSVYTGSLPYATLIDNLAYRSEQSVIDSSVMHLSESGIPTYLPIKPTEFYHPMFLRCFRWVINSTLQEKLLAYSSMAGLRVTILLDTNHPEIKSNGITVANIGARGIGVTDWTLSVREAFEEYRSSGVRVFLTPPGEYPSDFVTSFSLGPGKQHTVEVSMTQLTFKEGHFDNCVNNIADVQFVNPYDQTPYNHSYSYAYCYYYEYHKQFQDLLNASGDRNPLPWPLRHANYLWNLTGSPNFITINDFIETVLVELSNFAKNIEKVCKNNRPCSANDYSVSISSADWPVWPVQTRLYPFASSSVMYSWNMAKAKNLSVPALDFLVAANASSATSYARNNLLKVHFKPRRVFCDKITFSRDYGIPNFIAEVGGILGIYLGMSLLTWCEIVELIFELVSAKVSKSRGVDPSTTDSGAG